MTNQEYEKFYADSLAQAQQYAEDQMWPKSIPNIITTGTNYTITTTGNDPEWEKEYEVSRIVKRAENGYFFVISVDATDNVYYRIWEGGWFPYLVAKMFKRFGADIDGNKTTWNSVTQRSHLPATLGSAYEMIDEAIKGDMEDHDHDLYVRDLLTTKPENLKMIGSLEKLAEGDVDAPEEDPNTGSSHMVGGLTYSNAVAVTGLSAAMSSAIAGQPGNVMSFTNSAGPGDITGVATMEAKNILLNGRDIEETMSEKVKEAVDSMALKLAALEADVKEVSAP